LKNGLFAYGKKSGFPYGILLDFDGIQGYYIANLKMEERRHQSEIHLWWKSHNFGIEEAETKL